MDTTTSFSHHSCVVRAEFPGVKDTCSSSGFLLNPENGLVLTHGSILTDMCKMFDQVYSKIKKGDTFTQSDFGDGCRFDVLVESHWRRNVDNVCVTPHVMTRELNMLDATKKEDSSYTKIKCKVVGAFRNLDLHDLVSEIMPKDDWSFSSTNQDDSHAGGEDIEVPFQLLSYFILLKFEPPSLNPRTHFEIPVDHYVCNLRNNRQLMSLDKQLLNTQHKCYVGCTAEIVSTPFGDLNASVFFNSYSRGVVSNISGRHACWILTDARCLPGSEGAPLYTSGQPAFKRQLSGLIVAPLCWKNKEWVGFSLACGITSILVSLRESNLLQSLTSLQCIDRRDRPDVLALPQRVTHDVQTSHYVDVKGLQNVVLIQVGSIWGSGYIVDSQLGLIMTCSHVIKGYSSTRCPVLATLDNSGKSYQASVIHAQSSDDITPYDIALLKCPEVTGHISPPVKAKVIAPELGQSVYVYGHAVFDKKVGLHPSVSAGVISKVVRVKGEDIMVQSTCAVHAGASGGPLVDTNGNLIGIVVCNTVDKGSCSTYPHLNFSVPVLTVWPHIQHYITTGDVTSLKKLKVTDILVKKLWALDNSIESYREAKSKL